MSCPNCQDTGVFRDIDDGLDYYCECPIGDTLLEVEELAERTLDGDVLPPPMDDRTCAG